jgi:hypothetical protein
MAGPKVVLYSRTSCHLCEQARDLILAEQARSVFDFEEVLIDGDQALERDYGLRVPVVEVDGAEAFEFEVEPRRFASLVRG